MKYKIGDRFTTSYEPENFKDCIFEIYEIDEKNPYPFRVRIIKGGYGIKGIGYETDWRDEGDIKLITKSTMTKINVMMKKLLDADTRKLLKAGIINGDLMLTDKGREVLDGIHVETHKTALLTAADELIAEEKE